MVIFWEGCACTVKTFDSRLIFHVVMKRLTIVMSMTNGIFAKHNAMVHNNRSIECLQLFCVDLGLPVSQVMPCLFLLTSVSLCITQIVSNS